MSGVEVVIWISISVASSVSTSPRFSSSTLDRMGSVWRLSTIPETACNGARSTSLRVLIRSIYLDPLKTKVRTSLLIP
ncbi:MAG: hypothetical protein AW07_01516 [Candidatus Accumulibacter sp. SK-11]|nr:MAG: hypothetical protein AW07_01516 [Candidatus Accumulibacter sp. SK-11]